MGSQLPPPPPYNPWDPPPPPPPSSDFQWGVPAPSSRPFPPPPFRHHPPPHRHFNAPPPDHFHGPPDHFNGPPADHFNGPPPDHFNGPPPDHFNGPPDHFNGPPPGHFNGPPGKFNGPPDHFPGGVRKRKFIGKPDINAGFAKLYVVPLPRNICQDEVHHLFEEFGNVMEVVLLTDKKTGQQQEYCFVKYASIEEAERAIMALDNQFTFPGALGPLKLRYADGEKKRQGTAHVVQQDSSVSRSGTHYLGPVQHDSSVSRSGTHYQGPLQHDSSVSRSGAHYVGPVQQDSSVSRSGTHYQGPLQHDSSITRSGAHYVGPVQQDSSVSRSGTHSLGPVQHDSSFSGTVSAETEHKVYVNGLNREASIEEIAEIFSSYGDVADIYIMRDDLKRSRGCGFVGFSQRCMAIAAINGLNGTYMMKGCDSPLVVRIADPKKPKNGDFRPGTHTVDMRRSNVSNAVHLGNSSMCTKLSSAGEQAGTNYPVANQSRPHEIQQMPIRKPFSPSRLSQMSLHESQPKQSPKACIEVELNSAMQSFEQGSGALTESDYSEAFGECDWSEHICPDGDKYYFNCETSESRWEKPEEFAQCEQHMRRQKSRDRSRIEPYTCSTLEAPPRSEEDQIEAAQHQRNSCDIEKPQSIVSCAMEHSHEACVVGGPAFVQ